MLIRWRAQRIATPMPDDQSTTQGKDQIYVGGPLYDYAAKGSKVELIGKDGNAYKIKLTTKENVESTYLIDPNDFSCDVRSRRRARCRIRMSTSRRSFRTTGRRMSATWFLMRSTSTWADNSL